MISKIIFLIVSLFFILGILDYFRGNKWGLGAEFKKGIEASGALTLNMLGIFMIAPLFADILITLFSPITQSLGLDLSILPATFLAIDMGGFQLATELSSNTDLGLYFGVILSSMMGATLSFSIPVALGLIQKEDVPYFLKGLIIGMIAIPFGSLLGGMVQGIPFGILFYNTLPLLCLVGLLAVFIIYTPSFIIKCLRLLSQSIVFLSLIGLTIAGVSSILGVQVLPIDEAAGVVVRIGLFLGGAYPMLSIIQKLLQKPLGNLGQKIGVNEATLTGCLGNLASNLLLFSKFGEMNPRGKVIASAIGISGAFVFGGQLAFVNTVAAHMVIPFVTAKLSALCISLFLSILFLSKQK